MNSVHYISSEPLLLGDIQVLMTQPHVLELSASAVESIQNNYDFLHQKLSQNQEPIYGINTGFGSLCNTVIDSEHLSQLQINLVRSHACGMGEEVPTEIVRFIWVVKSKNKMSTLSFCIVMCDKSLFTKTDLSPSKV
jgi:histidine ammonia-lyase